MRGLAILTGGASGLGRFITERLATRDQHVVIADRDAAAASALLTELEEQGRSCTFLAVDVTKEIDVRRLFSVVTSLGRLELLVNNAGGWLPGPQFPDTENWRRGLDLNLLMPMLATQLALPLMVSGGAVVNVSSSGGWDSTPYGSPEYAAAKAGLIRFTTAVADFADRFGVRVSCVVPHWIGLPRAVKEFEQMDPEARARSGGLVEPGVVADAVVDLADDPDSAGRIVVVRAGHEPYPIDPASCDPLARASQR